MKTMRQTVLLASVLLAAGLHAPAALAQVGLSQAAVARQLLVEDREAKVEALVQAQRIRPDARSPELRVALIKALEQENALRRARWQASRRGETLEPIMDDIYGSVAQEVVEMRDPRAIPALAGAVGSGMMVIRALVEFGEPAARAVLEVVDSPNTTPQGVDGGLLALRMMVENSGIRPLSPDKWERIRRAALQHLTERQSTVVLWQAIDLAVVLDDPDLRRIVQLLASDRNEVIARGVTDPDLIERIQKEARERLAGVPPLPRQ